MSVVRYEAHINIITTCPSQHLNISTITPISTPAEVMDINIRIIGLMKPKNCIFMKAKIRVKIGIELQLELWLGVQN